MMFRPPPRTADAESYMLHPHIRTHKLGRALYNLLAYEFGSNPQNQRLNQIDHMFNRMLATRIWLRWGSRYQYAFSHEPIFTHHHVYGINLFPRILEGWTVPDTLVDAWVICINPADAGEYQHRIRIERPSVRAQFPRSMPLMLLPGVACEVWPGDVVTAVKDDMHGRPVPSRFWVALSMNWTAHVDFMRETFNDDWSEHPTPRTSEPGEFDYATPSNVTHDDWETEPLENDVNSVTSSIDVNLRDSDSRESEAIVCD